MKTNLQISFFSIATNTEISFNAFVTTFNDSYKLEWSSDSVFGRMDPIATYKNTSRTIACAFTMPAEDEEEAISIHDRFSTLLSLMYPNFSVGPGSKNATIASVPLFKVKYANYIMDINGDVKSQSARQAGLLGYFNDFKFDPNIDSNVFVKDGAIYRQSLNCSFTLNVIHTHRLGFIAEAPTATGTSEPTKIKPANNNGFPYRQNANSILFK